MRLASLIAVAMLAAAPPHLAGAVGPTLFSSPALSTSTIASAGGIVSVAVQAADLATIQSVTMQIRYPDGTETDTGLVLSGGNAASGTWSAATAIPRSFSRFDQYLSLIFSSRNASGVYSRSDPSTIVLQGTPPTSPQVAFTTVPVVGSIDPVAATTASVSPSDAVFVMNIQVPGLGWFTKPGCSAAGAIPAPVAADGSATASYATGGADQLATTIVGYLFPSGYLIPCLSGVDSVPSSFDAESLAVTSAVRTPPASLQFSGFDWTIKAPTVPVGPGNNYFVADNVFVDSQGLHLRLSQCQMSSGPAWCSAEVFANTASGYGTYTFTLSGPLSTLGPDTVVGLFLFGDNSAFAHHELDVEFWKTTSDSLGAQFTVQPAAANPPHRFAIPPGITTATASIAWTPSQIIFSIWQGANSVQTGSALIDQWVYDRTSSASDVPPNGDQHIHLNIWTQNPSATDPADAAEIVIGNVSFTSSQPSVLPFGIVSAASYEAGGVAPGEILSIFGNDLGPAEPTGAQPDASGQYAMSLDDSQVLFDGLPAPMLSAGANQLTLIAPFEVANGESTVVQVSHAGTLSDPVRLAVSWFKPGVFTIDQTGSGTAAIINGNGSVNSPGNPAPRGSLVSIYGTGGGQTNPPGVTGQTTPAVLSSLGEPVSVQFGGVAGTVTYAGGAPLEIGGLFQINVAVPEDAPTGSAVPLLVEVGEWKAQINATIAIQ